MVRLRDRFTQFKAHSPLSFRLLAYILICSSLFTLVASGIQLFSDYRRDISLIDQRMAMIETSYMSSLSSSVWALDQILLEIQLEGILSLPDIEYLILTVYPDTELSLGQQPEETNTIEHSFALSYTSKNVDQSLGSLTVVASMESIYRNLKRKLFQILATQGLKTFVLSFLIIFIIQHLVTRHLATMANYARHFSLQHLPRPLVLERDNTPGNQFDELTQVTDAINDMRSRLSEDLKRQSADAREIRKLSQAIEQSPSSVLICDQHWQVEYANQKFSQLTGHDCESIKGRHPGMLTEDSLSNRDSQQMWENIRVQVERAGVWQGELHSRRANGERFWEQVIITPLRDEWGKASHYLILGEDISIRKRYEEQLLRQANYDVLTGLPNRMLALDRLKLSLAQAKRNQEMVAVMFLDLDNFKHINDTLGHDAGDSLLMEAARRIGSCLRDSSTVARLGGDEFLVILPGLAATESSEQVARRILSVFQASFFLNGQEVFITTSIGISLFPEDASTSGDLLQNADAAMYEAKHQGRSDFRHFSPQMKKVTQDRLQMDNLLRRALELAEFELHYQPILHAATHRVSGAEALIRWHNPTLGLVMPDRFIPLAEETGLIIPIGRWVLNEACRAANRWQLKTRQPLRVAVNVSPRQFRDPGFVAMVESALQENQLAGHHLELEITERLILDNTIETAEILRQLDAMGVRLSVDDFGTGYSALSYLKNYPFDTLKIDKSFVQDVIMQPGDASLVKAIITMAHSLELQVVAEGVENAEQQAFLQQLQCDFAQGYYFSRPAPDADFLSWLLNQSTPSGS